jgi:transcriptional regulator with XRE-family HTH domain
MAFSENLRIARKQKGLSQEQLAESLDISRQAISKWESDEGYPETEKLIQIAGVLGVSLDYLLLDEQLTDKSNDDAPKKANGFPANGKITVRSYDGGKLSAYDEFVIIPVAGAGKRNPKCALGGNRGDSGFWKDGNTILGWYATIEDAQKELDAINHALKNGETSYQLQYFAKVEGRFNPKIVESIRRAFSVRR